MSHGRAFRMLEVADYLRVSHQRVAQMRKKSKLPDPEQVDGIGPPWKIERWTDREWWGTRRWRRRPKGR